MMKYLEAVKISFKNQLTYRFDILLSVVFTVSKIILAFVLWGAIFGTQQEVSGFTFHSMLSYYIINSFLTQLDRSNITGYQVANEIKNGLFSKYMVRPMSIFGYFTAQTSGVSLFLLFFNLAAALVWIFVFGVDFVFTNQLVNILYAAAFVLLGLLFMMQLNYYIGILAFKFLDTSIFMMIKQNIVEFITGSFIPLVLLPAGILRVMTWLPFYYVSYLPSMLLLGRNENEALPGLIILFLWNGIMGLVNYFTYRRLKYKYDGVGI